MTTRLTERMTNRLNDLLTNKLSWGTDALNKRLSSWRTDTLTYRGTLQGLKRVFVRVLSVSLRNSNPESFPTRSPAICPHIPLFSREVHLTKCKTTKELKFSSCNLMKILLIFNKRNFNTLLFVLCRERHVSGTDKLWLLHVSHLQTVCTS
jgi:hypothetical protein